MSELYLDLEAARKNREHIEQMNLRESKKALEPKIRVSHNKKRDMARKQRRIRNVKEV